MAVLVPPPVAVIPVSDGMEKYVLAHAIGADELMNASSPNVTTSGLFALPLAATVNGVVRVWLLPLVAVEKFHVTSLGVVEAAMALLKKHLPALTDIIGKHHASARCL